MVKDEMPAKKSDKQMQAQPEMEHSIQELKDRFHRGELSATAYEHELRTILNPLQRAKYPAVGTQSTPPETTHVRFSSAPDSLPQTRPNHPQKLVRGVTTQGTTPHSEEKSLSFDDLPVEEPTPKKRQNQNLKGNLAETTGRTSSHSLETLPLPLNILEPSTWQPHRLLHQRYQIELVLSQQPEECTFVALDLFLQERVTIHLASPNIAKTPAYRLRFARQYLALRDYSHQQVARIRHIEFRHNEGLLYAIGAHHPGYTLEQHLRINAAYHLPAASGERLLWQLSTLQEEFRQRTSRSLAPTLNDVIWDIKQPQEQLVLLRLRQPGPEQPHAMSSEVVASARILLALLSGSKDPKKKPLSEQNSTVTPRLESILQKAVDQQTEPEYPDILSFYEAYKQAMKPKIRTTTEPLYADVRTPAPPTQPPPTKVPEYALNSAHEIHAHVADLLSISTEASGQFCITAGKDRQLKWWDTRDWTLLHAETVEKAALTHTQLSPCGKLLAYCKSSHRVAISFADRLKMLCVLQHQSPVSAVRWFEGSEHVLTVTKDNAMQKWHIPTGELIAQLSHPQKEKLPPFIALCTDPEERLLVTLHRRGLISFWSMDAQKWLFDLPDSVSPANSISFLAPPERKHEGYLVSGHEDGKVRVWDYQTGALNYKVSAHGAPVHTVSVSQNQQWVASLDAQSELRLWRHEGGTLRPAGQLYQPPPKTRAAKQNNLKSCLFINHPERPQVVARGEGSMLFVWELSQ